MDEERQRLLKSRGYTIRQYERILPPDNETTPTLTWPQLKQLKDPAPDGSDYESFPAVFAPNGTAIRPYGDNGEPLALEFQWDVAWEHYTRRGAKGGALYKGMK